MARRRLHSIQQELITKSHEAALSAIQTFNNPLIKFKSETFIVLMMVAWTYLLHAYFRAQNIEYRYYEQRPKRRRFYRTKHGAYRHWELEHCLNDDRCPLDRDTKNNLKFLIGLRHEIEHQMTLDLDNWLSGRYQACALNYNHYVQKLFGKKYGLGEHLTYSIQFVELSNEQIAGYSGGEELPDGLRAYIAEFDDTLSDEEAGSPRYKYKLLFTRNLVNSKGQADRVIEFVDPESEAAKELEKQYVAIKEVERPKYLPKEIVGQMRKAGFKGFTIYDHTQLWQRMDARNLGKGYGTYVGKTWYWYQSWVDIVREYCELQGYRDSQ